MNELALQVQQQNDKLLEHADKVTATMKSMQEEWKLWKKKPLPTQNLWDQLRKGDKYATGKMQLTEYSISIEYSINLV